MADNALVAPTVPPRGPPLVYYLGFLAGYNMQAEELCRHPKGTYLWKAWMAGHSDGWGAKNFDHHPIRVKRGLI